MREFGVRRNTQSVRELLLADDPDPRLLQGGLASFLTLAYALAFAGGASIRDNPWPLVAIVVTLVGFAVAVLVPWQRVPRIFMAVLPLLDIAALGVARLNDVGGGAASILIVMPALWLGWQFGRRGALIATFGVLGFAALPALVYFGVTRELVSRGLLTCVVSGAAAMVIALSLEKTQEARRNAERRGIELAAALETIKHQRRMSEAIFESVDVGLVLLDRDGVYQGMNRRHRDFMQLAYPDGHGGVSGQLGVVFEPDGTTPLRKESMPTWRASHGEEFDDDRIWVGDDPLTRRALSVSARTVLDDQGAHAGAALAYKDVTEFMQTLRGKDEFVASVSHELRTPLTSILGYVQILQERDDLPADVVSHLAVVMRNADRLRRLVADLLQTAQDDAGPMQVSRTMTDLAQIVRDSIQAAGPLANSVGVELVADLPLILPALVDPQRIAQVVDNLVSNAIKYNVEGGRVNVCLRVEGRRIELEVADTGIGISASDRDRLFTRFFRARHAEERSIQGVGLGLSISKAIVEAHGGRLEVDSEVGRGSVFQVRLPIGAVHPVGSMV